MADDDAKHRQKVEAARDLIADMDGSEPSKDALIESAYGEMAASNVLPDEDGEQAAREKAYEAAYNPFLAPSGPSFNQGWDAAIAWMRNL